VPDEAASASDLLQWLREVAHRCGGDPKAAADGLATGFQQVDDVIVLLQPLRVVAQEDHEALVTTLQRLAEKNFLTGTQPIGEGGVWVALVRGCAAYGRGFHADLSECEGATPAEALLGERDARVLVSTRPKAHVPLANFVERGGRLTAEAIGRVTAGEVRVRWMGETVFQAASIAALAR
jgi:phosphoribosylformylglycinamidine (FGAM) synthase-like enzyme